MKVKSESEVAQSCPPLSDPMDCSLPGSSVHGIFQAGVLEWGATAFSITDGYRAEKHSTHMATTSRKTTLALPCMTVYLEFEGFSGEKQSIFPMNVEGFTLIGIRIKLPNFRNRFIGTFLVVQWLRFQSPSAEGPGSTPD